MRRRNLATPCHGTLVRVHGDIDAKTQFGVRKADFFTVFAFSAFGVKMRLFLHQTLAGEREILVGGKGAS